MDRISFSPPPGGGAFTVAGTIRCGFRAAMPPMVYDWDDQTARNATVEERYPAVRVLGI